MIEIKGLHTCSFQTALEVWNRGFQSYVVDLTLSLDGFLTRISSEGVSPEYSFIAFLEGKPVGFLLNGIRISSGRKFAWNGGTGVVPELRGRGIGRALVETALDLYAQELVDIATLEAISSNESAIALYQKCGYEVVDELMFLQTDKPIDNFVSTAETASFTVKTVAPAAVGTLSFYRELSPWQAQWQTLALCHGEGILVLDARGTPLGYALFKKKFDDKGRLSSVALYQCEVAPNQADSELIASLALQSVFSPELGTYRRATYNLRKSNELVVKILLRSGFTTFIEQVLMLNAIEA